MWMCRFAIARREAVQTADRNPLNFGACLLQAILRELHSTVKHCQWTVKSLRKSVGKDLKAECLAFRPQSA